MNIENSRAIFDLEQYIMQCWAVVDDLKLITEHFSDDPQWEGMDPKLSDALLNKYFGLAEVYDVKMQKMWDTFEIVCREYHTMRRASKQTYGVEHESNQELS